MNSPERQCASFLEGFQSRNYQLARWRENDNAIELDRRRVIASSNPDRSHLTGKLLMALITCKSVDIDSPMSGNLYRHMPRRAESEEPEALSRIPTGDSGKT